MLDSFLILSKNESMGFTIIYLQEKIFTWEIYHIKESTLAAPQKSFIFPVFDKTQEITKETDCIYKTNTIVESSNKIWRNFILGINEHNKITN